MKKYLITLFILILICIGCFFVCFETTEEEAIEKQMNKHLSSKDHNYQVINDKHSDYSIVLTSYPYRVVVFKTITFFGRYHTSFQSTFQLSDHFSKDAANVTNCRLPIGTVILKPAQKATYSSEPIQTVFLGKFVNSSDKYCWLYKDLFFWYLDKPLKSCRKINSENLAVAN